MIPGLKKRISIYRHSSLSDMQDVCCTNLVSCPFITRRSPTFSITSHLGQNVFDMQIHHTQLLNFSGFETV